MTNSTSWVESANQPLTDFPLQNLPYGVFGTNARIGVAIGDSILDLRGCASTGLLNSLSPETVRACAAESLNALLALGSDHWSPLRRRLTELLAAESPQRPHVEPLLIARAGAPMHLPAAIGDYTDFFTSIYHASNVGNLFRPGNPLAPNYKHLPIGYHGRASSIVVSGTPIHRPAGQIQEAHFGPTRALDYELEVGAFVGPANRLGEPVPIGQARSHIFGLCLLNDWSARDIQVWESQPLGPFLAKSFATTISPWIVPLEAFEPFRAPAFTRPAGDPAPLPYLYSPEDQARGGIDIIVEVWLASQRMREAAAEPVRISRGNFRDTYWTIAQMLAHHTSNGCNLRPGDLFGSGTVSGPTRDSLGCLLELTRRGTEPFHLPTGEDRRYLEDGDEVILRAHCEREGCVRIGFGECRGTIAT
ncbi:MAG TPA: fumarylacetoacetase [Bryobacteraceae bacterium]|nr:fumarylacetoacetase [Bryobacteraceae bacterium]